MMTRKSYRSKLFVGFFPARGKRSTTVLKRVSKERKLDYDNLYALPKPGVGWEIWKFE